MTEIDLKTIVVTDELRIDAETLARAGIKNGDQAAISVDSDGVHIAAREVFGSGEEFFRALERELDEHSEG